MEPGDRLRLRKVAAGDKRALSELYERHAGLLALRLRRAGASVEETEDIIQETFLDVWQSAQTFRGESAVAGWMWGIARRKLNMLVRGEIRFRDRQVKAVSGTQDSILEDDLVVEGLETQRAYAQLSPDLKTAFQTVVVEGLTTTQAADRLDIPEGTVKSRVHRARQIMRKELK